jgi:FKBP-type peptidyl-prolyl cis-trans isomerase SlyD
MADRTVSADCVVLYEYRFLDAALHEHLETEDEAVAYLHGHGEVLAGVERAMEGRPVGASFSVSLPPEEAFGEKLPDSKAERRVPKDDIESFEHLAVGDAIDALEEDLDLWVKAIDTNDVVLTLNHPLAGETLSLELTVVDIRPANPRELEVGLAFGWSGTEEPEWDAYEDEEDDEN